MIIESWSTRIQGKKKKGKKENLEINRSCNCALEKRGNYVHSYKWQLLYKKYRYNRAIDSKSKRGWYGLEQK